TNSSISGLLANTYTIQVKDANDCIKTELVPINEASSITVNLSTTPTSCFNGSDGSATANAIGGNPPYSYSWMPGNVSGPTIAQITAGTYTVTVVDANGCTTVDSITIIQPTIITTSLNSINATCSNPNGQATVIANGGTPGYNYLWLPAGGTNSTATSLMAGLYTIKITDNNGCVVSDTITVQNSSNPTASITSVTNLTCFGSNNGTATVAANGGQPPYSYIWLPGGNTNVTATGLSAGNYTITITDANNCTSTPVVSPSISQPPPIFINPTILDVSCFGNNNGSITATINGGTPGYSYLWTPGASTINNISNLATGNYTLQVTDLNSCVELDSFTVSQPTSNLAVSTIAVPTTCFNGNNGSATANATGGNPPYSYSWMPGNISGPSIAQVTAGTYTVTVVDAKGCTSIDSVYIGQPTAITTILNSINATCGNPNGQANIVAAGGTPGYNYLWLPTGGTNSAANSLITGLYTINVTDNNGCMVTDTITVQNIASPTATITSVTNLTCFGSNNGTATVAVNGGQPPYSYLWQPGGNTNATATGLATGNYTVTVTDANNCSSTPVVSNNISQPPPIFIDTLISQVTCSGNNDGSIASIVSGGTSPYNYVWSPSNMTNSSISNLGSNTYTLQVTDANGCSKSDTFVLSEPLVLNATISSITHVSCFSESSGSATVSVSGGTQNYYYNWQPIGGNGPTASNLVVGNYFVSITDENGCVTTSNVTINEPIQVLSATSASEPVTCNGQNNGTITISSSGGTPGYNYVWTPSVSTNDTAVNLSPGHYMINIIDSNGCETIVNEYVIEPIPMTGVLSTINPSCNQANGSISTQISGGSAPYTYLWQQSAATTSYITGLNAGSYSVIITDSANCSLSLSTNVTYTPSPIATATNLINVSCYGGNDGQASVFIANGTPPFNIAWQPYGGFDSTATSLDTGTYVVSVTDALGCFATDTAIIDEPEAVDISGVDVTDVLCNTSNNGEIAVSVIGGTAPYSYLWSPIGETTTIASNLSAGTYSLTISDQKNCSKSISVIVDQPPMLNLTVDSIINPICPTTTGVASVMASGGHPPYSYAWSAPAENEINSTAFNIYAGTYTVTVMDSNGCTTSTLVYLTAPTNVVTVPSAMDTLCLGQTATISATAFGGASGYTYAWQPTAAVTGGSLTISPNVNTTYTVVAYDQNGCPGNSDTINITVYDLTTSNIIATGTSPICPGQSTYISVSSVGTTGPLNYQWNNNLGSGSGGFLVTPNQPTTYIVTATNACGSSVNDTVDILFNPPPSIDLSLLPTEICSLSNVLFDDNSFSGNSNDPITNWLWDFGDGNQSTEQDPIYSYSNSGNYIITLTISTGAGCTASNSTSPFIITANPTPMAAFSMNDTYLNLPNESLILTNLSTGADSYLWNFGDGTTSSNYNPTYNYSTIGTFNVQLITMNQYGCADTATAELTTDADVIFPTAFTPNPDGPSGGNYDINDYSNNVFFPYTSGVIEYELQIFNRWGELIFESSDVKKGWDGYYRDKQCQQDVYVWKAYVRLSNGKVFEKVGNVTLIE
ncbi:MAG: PKD domain-containing protein, partial [Bacteroidia bacterium]